MFVGGFVLAGGSLTLVGTNSAASGFRVDLDTASSRERPGLPLQVLVLSNYIILHTKYINIQTVLFINITRIILNSAINCEFKNGNF